MCNGGITKTLVSILAARLPFQLPANGSRKAAKDGSGVWVSVTHVRGVDGAPGFCLFPALAFVAIWGSGPAGSRSLSLSLFLCNSDSQGTYMKIFSLKIGMSVLIIRETSGGLSVGTYLGSNFSARVSIMVPCRHLFPLGHIITYSFSFLWK